MVNLSTTPFRCLHDASCSQRSKSIVAASVYTKVSPISQRESALEPAEGLPSPRSFENLDLLCHQKPATPPGYA